MTAPGDRPNPDDDRLTVPVNPCVACWRVRHLLIPATHVAENGVRRIVLCARCTAEFKEMDQDHRGVIGTTYREIQPGETVRVKGTTL